MKLCKMISPIVGQVSERVSNILWINENRH